MGETYLAIDLASIKMNSLASSSTAPAQKIPAENKDQITDLINSSLRKLL